MRDPALAIWLYVAIVVVQVMFSKKWSAFWKTLLDAKNQKVGATATGSAATTGGTQGH